MAFYARLFDGARLCLAPSGASAGLLPPGNPARGRAGRLGCDDCQQIQAVTPGGPLGAEARRAEPLLLPRQLGVRLMHAGYAALVVQPHAG